MNRQILYIKSDPSNLFTPKSDLDVGEVIAICHEDHVFGSGEQASHFGIVIKDITIAEEDDLLVLRKKGISRANPTGALVMVDPADYKVI